MKKFSHLFNRNMGVSKSILACTFIQTWSMRDRMTMTYQTRMYKCHENPNISQGLSRVCFTNHSNNIMNFFNMNINM